MHRYTHTQNCCSSLLSSYIVNPYPPTEYSCLVGGNPSRIHSFLPTIHDSTNHTASLESRLGVLHLGDYTDIVRDGVSSSLPQCIVDLWWTTWLEFGSEPASLLLCKLSGAAAHTSDMERKVRSLFMALALTNTATCLPGGIHVLLRMIFQSSREPVHVGVAFIIAYRS